MPRTPNLSVSKGLRSLIECRKTAERLRLYTDITQKTRLGLLVWRLENPNEVYSLRLIGFNSAAEQALGFRVSAFLGKTIAEIFLGALETEEPEILRKVTLNGGVGDLHSLADGRTPAGIFATWVFSLPNRCVEETVTALLGISMTDAERACREIRQKEEALRRLSGRLFRLQDDERRRMAREMHDSTGQCLSALTMKIGVALRLAGSDDPNVHAALTEALDLAKECSSEIRTLSYLLHPPALDADGLAAALNSYVEGFTRRSAIRVELEIAPTLGRLPQDVETTLFRIVQEALTNVHRHSQSPTAKIRVVQDSAEVTLEVQDEGQGMPPETLSRAVNGGSGLGVGITGMRERLRQLGGRLEISSNGRGTTVSAILPVS